MNKLLAIMFATVAASAANAGPSLTFGVGKALNNNDTANPGWVYSGHATLVAGRYDFDVGYTRLGRSWLGENAAITTAGIGYRSGKLHYGVAEIIGASYSAEVWWDSEHPDRECYKTHCGKKYRNSGTTFSRACHLCGTVVSLDYALTRNISVRGEYYGLLHMNPTFQGVVVQLTYSVH